MLHTDDDVIADYAEFMAQPLMQKVLSRLSGDQQQGINACVECCDRHVGQNKVALNWIGEDGSRESYTFEQLQVWSAQFANVLKARGIGVGDRVAGLLPRRVELLIVVLGTWRAGGVYQPLFVAFGPESITHRLTGSEAKLVVTSEAHRNKLNDIKNVPPVLTVGAQADVQEDFYTALNKQSDVFAPVMLKADAPFQMLFTSGTTGRAKGVMVPLYAMLAFDTYMRYAVDLREGDVLWNIADPGWAYGLYYGITGPFLMGHAITFYEGSFSVGSTYRLIHELGITNLMGAPTAYRMLMAGGDERAKAIKGQLRVVSSAGEPLNPEVIRWFADTLGVVVHDHYGQTETGMTVCNHHALKHTYRMGTAGFALPGYRAVVLGEQGQELPVGEPGTLALDRSQSPLFFFPGYWQQDQQPFKGDYYLTGDTVELNEDGSFSFVGRNDDVITSSGYRIGPFDVESCLIEHEAVAEAAVVGKSDAERHEIVKAFVVLKSGFVGDAVLMRALSEHVKHRLAAHAYPREVEFVDELPKTPSGKIQRFLLKTQGSAAKSTL